MDLKGLELGRRAHLPEKEVRDDHKVREEIARKVRDVMIPFNLVNLNDGVFTDKERATLLNSLKSIFAYTGCAVPDQVTLEDGTQIDLRDLMWRLLERKDPDEETVAYARALARILEGRVETNKKMIETYDLTDEEAEALYFEACGLMRAIMDLKGYGGQFSEDDVQMAMKKAKMGDAKRLLEFIKKLK